jgi:exopolysaccharide biosynthesis polyprenyl glycosylphosphotransferase
MWEGDPNLMALRFLTGAAARASAPGSPETRPRFVAARRAQYVVLLTLAVDLIAVTLAYWAAGVGKIDRKHVFVTDPVMIATIPCWLLVFFISGMYSRRLVLEPSLGIPRVLNGITLSIFMTVVVAFASGVRLSREWTLLLWVSSVVLVFAGRFMVLRLTQWLHVVKWLGLRTVIVGNNGEARTLARVLVKKRQLGYEVLGFVGPLEGTIDRQPVLGPVGDIRQIVIDHDIAAVFIARSDIEHDVLTQVDRALVGLGVRVRLSLGLPYMAASRVLVRGIDGMAMLSIERVPPSEFHLRLKRGFDVTLAAIGIIFGLPVMIGIALVILVTDGRPIIFSQKRVGAGGRLFTMYKFRTMVKNAERLRPSLEEVNEAGGVLFKIRKDPRIMPFGRQLRRFGADELPQLLNILLGEMSLVGPRPALPEEMERWTPELVLRLNARPGLTGLWQVNGRHELAFDDYVRYDVFYVENWSLALDFQIIARTIPALLSRSGAY